MRAEQQELNSRLEAMSREELILSIRRLLEENAEKDAQLDINSSVATEMAIQFQQIKDENAALKTERRVCKDAFTDIYQLLSSGY